MQKGIQKRKGEKRTREGEKRAKEKRNKEKKKKNERDKRCTEKDKRKEIATSFVENLKTLHKSSTMLHFYLRKSNFFSILSII